MAKLKKPRGKQARFCEAYVECLNITQAAAEVGYSRQRASYLVNHDPVCIAYIEYRKTQVLNELDITPDNVLAELKDMAFANMLDFAEWDADGVTLVNSEDLTRAQAAGILKISPVVSAGKLLGTSVELANKQKALETLAKHVGILVQPATGKRDDPIHTMDLASVLVQAWKKIDQEQEPEQESETEGTERRDDPE